MKIKNIVFDLDGTIINSEKGVVKSITYALKTQHILHPSREDLLLSIGPPLTDTFVSRFGVKKEHLWDAMAAFHEVYDTTGMLECDLYPKMDEVIRKLAEEGFLLGVTTSKNESAARKILQHFQLDTFFKEIVGSAEDGKIEKKDEIIEEFFIRCPDLKRSETILIGDTAFDAEGAKKTGIACLGVSYGFGTTASLKKCDVVSIADSPKAILSYFEA